MEIIHDGIVSQQQRYKYAVKQNNKSNIIIFKFAKQQDSIVLDPNKHFYVKVRNSGKTYSDKDPNVVVTSTETDILVSWTMLRKATQFKNIDIQVQYEDTENDIVWQSALINLDLFDTIQADKVIEDKYPSILMLLQKQIDELKVDITPPEGGKGIIVTQESSKNVISIDEDVVQQKEEGKGLSSNDYTDEDKTKLSGVAEGATKVIVLASTPNGCIVINNNQVQVFNDQELRNLIAGKETGWVIDRQNQITGTKDDDDNYTNVTAIEGLNLEEVKIGDNVYIKDRAVPDYWVSGRTVTASGVVLELTTLSTKIDLSVYYTKTEIQTLLQDYLDLTSAQTISGVKTFSGEQTFINGKIGNSNNTGVYALFDNSVSFYMGNVKRFSIGAGNIVPKQQNFDIGSAQAKFRDLYLSGKLYGATKNADVDDIIDGIVTKGTWKANDEYLSAIIFGGKNYNLIPCRSPYDGDYLIGKNASATYSGNIAFGDNSFAGEGHDNISLGTYAEAHGWGGSVALGFRSYSRGNSIALGYGSRATISDSVCCDSTSKNRIHSIYSPSEIFFRYENVHNVTTNETKENYTNGKTLQQLLDLRGLSVIKQDNITVLTEGIVNEIIKGAIFIPNETTETLGNYRSIVFFPTDGVYGSYIYGNCWIQNSGLYCYEIKSNREYKLNYLPIINYGSISANNTFNFNIGKIKNRTLNAYPTDKTKQYKWVLEPTTGNINFVEENVTHVINVATSTSQGTYRYQFQLSAPESQVFTQLAHVADYLYTKKPNLRLNVSGTYTENNDVYIIVGMEAISATQMRLEMYKAYDGTYKAIDSGAIDVTDTIM